MVSFWDACRLGPAALGQLDELQERLTGAALPPGEEPQLAALPDDAPSAADSESTHSFYRQMEVAMVEAEASCRASLEILDTILATTSSVTNDFEDVTGRTNSLMAKCENLLEQQHTLQSTVEILQKTLQPFNDIEEIAATLGIPYDNSAPAAGKATGSSSSGGGGGGAVSQINASNIDPRSPEFQDILRRLSQAIAFLKKNRDIHDCTKYMAWLEKLQTRATSLIGRTMRELLERAHKQCRELRGPHGTAGSEDGPLEAAAVYTKFRGLSYRMKELTSVLLRGHLLDGIQDGGGGAGGGRHLDHGVLLDCRKHYALLRAELLLPMVKGSWIHTLRTSPLGHGVSASSTDLAQFIPDLGHPAAHGEHKGVASPRTGGQGKVVLGNAVRQAFAVLLRVAQLEAQLFDSLFFVDAQVDSPKPGTTTPTGSAASSTTASTTLHVLSPSMGEELRGIIEGLSISVRDLLRPLIIKEQSLDELCQLISSLSEDMQAQISSLHLLVPSLRTVLTTHLAHLLNDAKERLLYVAQVRLRQEVQMFEPLPSQLAYPDLLMRHYNAASRGRLGDKARSDGGVPAAALEGLGEDEGAIEEVYETWYPPLRQALSLLSKLYTLIDKRVFEDFSLHAVQYCVAALKAGALQVKRRNGQNLLHGDLFLIRHLLVLREQLQPFDMKLQVVERALDFSSTSSVLQRFLQAPAGGADANAGGPGAADGGGSAGAGGAAPAHASQLRLDASLPAQLLALAQSSAPGMAEVRIDVKKELDAALKQACVAMKQSACKLLLGPLDAFLAKVTAFVGEIPVSEGGSGKDAAALTAAQGSTLRAQAFAREERVREVVAQLQHLTLQRLPDFKQTMQLYVDNGVARHVLLKPIAQEVALARRRMDVVVRACLEPAAVKELDQALHAVAYSVASELANA